MLRKDALSSGLHHCQTDSCLDFHSSLTAVPFPHPGAHAWYPNTSSPLTESILKHSSTAAQLYEALTCLFFPFASLRAPGQSHPGATFVSNGPTDSAPSEFRHGVQTMCSFKGKSQVRTTIDSGSDPRISKEYAYISNLEVPPSTFLDEDSGNLYT